MESPKKLHPFLSQAEIKALNQKLGEKITEDYAKLLSPGDTLLVVVTLKGAILFAADLIREITAPIIVDFVRVASYGTGTQSSGKIKLIKDLETSPKGQHVLILDEIVDSGRTLAFLRELLQREEPKTLRVCALLNKASRREVPVEVEYVGKEVEDKFLVGYGLDFNEKYRNLAEIYYVADN